MKVYVGLDCGGSSSRVMALDQVGNVVFQGQSGPANLVSTPEPRLKKNLANAIDGCPNATFVCGCFAGLIGDESRQLGIKVLRDFFPGASVRAEPDYTAAFYATPPETDVCIISGTGSLVCSREGNQMHKSGGRGYILGDFGSGYHFGRDALLQYLDEPSKRSKTMTRAIQEIFHTEDESAIVGSIYHSPTPAGVLSRLAKPLGADAKDGEPYALASVDRNLGLLLQVVKGHVDRFVRRTPSLNLCLAGGVWKASPIFKDRFTELASAVFSDRELTVNRVTRPPLYGAVELAKEMEQFGN